MENNAEFLSERSETRETTGYNLKGENMSYELEQKLAKKRAVKLPKDLVKKIKSFSNAQLKKLAEFIDSDFMPRAQLDKDMWADQCEEFREVLLGQRTRESFFASQFFDSPEHDVLGYKWVQLYQKIEKM